ncbi:MAG: transketolase [Spirochaetia bacterium]|nr:transketolase [Spirochaetia bacterium]
MIQESLVADKYLPLREKIRNKNKKDVSFLEVEFMANQIRRYIIDMVHTANSGHPGGALGLADIFAMLYFKILNIDSKNAFDKQRDRLFLSNGHVCAVRYAAMALAGFFPEEELYTFRKLGSRLQGHPSTYMMPELENSSGSLGQGLSAASGCAIGLKTQNIKSRVIVGISDGECQEGMTWEAAMAAGHYKLSNLTAFVDYNKIQIDGFTDSVMTLGDLKQKFESFGWFTLETNGHDLNEIEKAFQRTADISTKPEIILFNTVLGKGVSFMENNPAWHGSPPNKEERDRAMKELDDEAEKIAAKL